MQPRARETRSRQTLEKQEGPSPRASRDSMSCRHLNSSSSFQNCYLIPPVCGHLLRQPQVTDAGPATTDLFPWRQPVSGLLTGAANSRSFHRPRWPSQVGGVRLAGVRCSLMDTPNLSGGSRVGPSTPHPTPDGCSPVDGGPSWNRIQCWRSESAGSSALGPHT